MQDRMPYTAARYGLATIAAIILATAIWSGHSASAQQLNWFGRITSLPAGGLVGEWNVEGRTFVTTAATDFRQDKGAFAVGVCVEVEYVGTAEPYSATKIASKSSDNCSSGTPTSSVTPSVTPSSTPSVTPSETPTAPAEREAYGLVQSMPSPGFVGAWFIGDLMYNATVGTSFKQAVGPLAAGTCAKVHYSGSAPPFSAREIESKPASDCSGPTPTSGATPSATPTDEVERYGRIESFPANLTGNWVVGGVTYTATASTEYEQEDGAFAVGVCVKIHALTTTTPATLREIETARDYVCAGTAGTGETGGTAGEGEIYGVLQSFPANLIGEWNVAGMTYVADADTEFVQVNGLFAVGVTVKVHFSTDATGVNRAREIDTKFANDSGGSDDDGNGSYEGAEGHAYGIADSVPGGLVGAWSIGGTSYTATADTKFEQNNGALVNRARVKVEYYLGSSGERIAKKIESTAENGGATAPDNFKVFGFVDQMPSGGLVGTWIVDNVAYVAGASARFDERNAVLGIGGYVAVEYYLQGGMKQVHEIEAHVPPGAGPQSFVGMIDDKGGATVMTAADDGAQVNTWVIGGVSYSVIPATSFNDFFGSLNVGATAVVNSYETADGTLVATQIRSITLTTNLFMPAVRR
jgi:hypothetical protein